MNKLNVMIGGGWILFLIWWWVEVLAVDSLTYKHCNLKIKLSAGHSPRLDNVLIRDQLLGFDLRCDFFADSSRMAEIFPPRSNYFIPQELAVKRQHDNVLIGGGQDT